MLEFQKRLSPRCHIILGSSYMSSLMRSNTTSELSSSYLWYRSLTEGFDIPSSFLRTRHQSYNHRVRTLKEDQKEQVTSSTSGGGGRSQKLYAGFIGPIELTYRYDGVSFTIQEQDEVKLEELRNLFNQFKRNWKQLSSNSSKEQDMLSFHSIPPLLLTIQIQDKYDQLKSLSSFFTENYEVLDDTTSMQFILEAFSHSLSLLSDMIDISLSSCLLLQIPFIETSFLASFLTTCPSISISLDSGWEDAIYQYPSLFGSTQKINHLAFFLTSNLHLTHRIMVGFDLMMKTQLRGYGGPGYDFMVNQIRVELNQAIEANYTHEEENEQEPYQHQLIEQIFSKNAQHLFSWYQTPPPPPPPPPVFSKCDYCGDLFERKEGQYYHKFNFIYCSGTCLNSHRKEGWMIKDI